MPVNLDTIDCYIHTAEPAPDPVSLIPKRALEFDRTRSQYAWIPHTKSYEGLAAFTLNTWIMPKGSVQGGYPVYIEKKRGGDQSIGIFQSPAGKFHMGINTGTWSANDTITTPVANRWYMLTIRYDGATCKGYVNGVEEFSFAKTGTVITTTDHWWIAYRNTGNLYMSMGLAELELWNYALDPAEIAARYTPPNSCAYKPAYIHIENVSGEVSSSQPLFINSDISQTNPGVSLASLGAMISTDAEVSTQMCYMASGQGQLTDFDMTTDVQNRSNIVFDNIIFIRGGLTNLREYKIGSVEYPITRDAMQAITVLTKDVPGIDTAYLDCYINKHHTIEANIPAFINVGNDWISNVHAFISGPFSGISTQVACYIAGEFVVSQDAFIEGVDQGIEASLAAHICGETVAEMNTELNAYVVAQGPTEHIYCFIQTGEPVDGGQDAYISGPEVHIFNSAMMGHIFGAGQISRPKYAYIEGVFYEELSVGCYIVTNDVDEVSVGAMVMSSTPNISVVRIFMGGAGQTSNAMNAFIHSNAWELAPRASFIHGLVGRESAKSAFIGCVETLVKAQDVYLPGSSHRFSSANAFIQSNFSVESKPCYIVTEPAVGGTNSSTANSYIAGLNVSTAVKNSYVVSIGQRFMHRRAHISG